MFHSYIAHICSQHPSWSFLFSSFIFEFMPRIGTAGSYGSSVRCSSVRPSYWFLQWTQSVYTLTNSRWGFLFSHGLTSVHCTFLMLTIQTGETWTAKVDLVYNILVAKDIERFKNSYWPFVFLLLKDVRPTFETCSWLAALFLLCLTLEALYIFLILTPCLRYRWKGFYPIFLFLWLVLLLDQVDLLLDSTESSKL